MKLLVGALVVGAALVALTPLAVGAAAAARGNGFGARDDSGPISGASFGPAAPANMGPHAGAVGDMAAMAGLKGGQQYSLVAVAATQLQMERTDLVAELSSGKTIAQVAAEHNVATTTIVDAFVAARTDLLKTAVADGRITQAQADTMLTQIRAHATEQVNEPWTSWTR